MANDQVRAADRFAIQDVLHQYARATDSKDLNAYMACFHEDATFQIEPGPPVPVKDFAGGFETSWKTYVVTAHHLSNHLVTFDGDSAESEIYVNAYHLIAADAPADDPLFPGKGEEYAVWIGGRYSDHLLNGEDGWKIQARRLEFLWSMPVDTSNLPSMFFPNV